MLESKTIQRGVSSALITKYTPWSNINTVMELEADGGDHLPSKILYKHNDTIYEYIRKVIKTKHGNFKK